MSAGLALGSRRLGGRPIVARARAALRTEAGLAGLATGLLALHVADDNFLQPQPGTSAADHLVSGLVPLALLVAFVAGYTQLRAGARAGIAIALGLFGIAAGVGEAGYYTLETGPSGDDYTGLLAIPAGLLLAGVGVATLWRSRRLDDGRLWRYLRRALLAAAAVVTAYFVVAPLAVTYIFTHSARAAVPAAKLGARTRRSRSRPRTG